MKLELPERQLLDVLHEGALFPAAQEFGLISKPPEARCLPINRAYAYRLALDFFREVVFEAVFRSPRSPCPGFAAVFAFLRRSWDSERLTSSLSLIRPAASRRMYRLAPRGAISSRLAADFLGAAFFVARFAIINSRTCLISIPQHWAYTVSSTLARRRLHCGRPPAFFAPAPCQGQRSIRSAAPCAPLTRSLYPAHCRKAS